MTKRKNLETLFCKSHAELMEAVQTYGVHECADLFPYMEERELRALADDIEKKGQQETIKCIDGKIIDGRNRFMACTLVEVEPKMEDIEVSDALDYVMSTNLHRRHLGETQRAWVGANITLKHSRVAKTQAIKMMNISLRSLNSAIAVIKSGSKDLQDKVQYGQIPVYQAEQIAKLDEGEQKRLVALPKTKVGKALRDLKKPDTPEDEGRTIKVAVSFTEEEIKSIDKAVRLLGEDSRAAFIRQAATQFAKERLPPTKEEINEIKKIQRFKGHAPKFVKRKYSYKDMIVGKNGMSKQEEDYEKEMEAFEEAEIPCSFDDFLEAHNLTSM